MATDSHELLGAASISEGRRRVPVPEPAVNRELVPDAGETYWAVGDDDVVVISRDYDSLREEEGLSFLGSTTIDEERALKVPDEAFDEWGAVEEGDTLHFVTTDPMAAEDQVMVMPEEQAEDLGVLGDPESADPDEEQ